MSMQIIIRQTKKQKKTKLYHYVVQFYVYRLPGMDLASVFFFSLVRSEMGGEKQDIIMKPDL